MIGLVILDIDGVLSDGKKYYNTEGMPELKTFCDKDFTAIKRLRGAGVNVCFLSGDNRINEAMAKNRNIDFYYARGQDKADFLPMFTTTYGVSSENMVYIGDDLFDLGIMEKVGHPYCPSDSCKKLKDLCGENTLLNKGGDNVVAELVEVLLETGLINDCTLEDIENLDKQEVF